MCGTRIFLPSHEDYNREDVGGPAARAVHGFLDEEKRSEFHLSRQTLTNLEEHH